tara:strand:+ start:6292 stop:6498 length:207 start_codon:yes stop_codon:yes gene_type:complete
VEDVVIYLMMGVMFFFVVMAVLEFISFLGYRNSPVIENCIKGHSWEYGNDGDLVCLKCKRKAKDIING